MGLITTYLAARFAVRRELRRSASSDLEAVPVLPVFHCRSCGAQLVLSIHWPGIDPIYWEDHLGGICTNCFDS